MRKGFNKGFTLIELLIVIAIIGILAAVLIPNLLSARQRANDTAAQSLIRNAVTQAEASRTSSGDPASQFGNDGTTAVNCDAEPLELNVPTSISACEVKQGANESTGYIVSASGKKFVLDDGTIVEDEEAEEAPDAE